MQPNINTNDIPVLMNILKKLGLSVPKVIKSQKFLSSNKYSADEKARKLFGLNPEDDLSAFLEERLTAEEIAILKTNIGL